MAELSVRDQISHVAKKAVEYTEKFKKLRERCEHFKYDKQWKQTSCFYYIDTSHICSPLLCPLND